MDSTSAPTEPAANVISSTSRSIWIVLARSLLVAMAFLLALTTARNADVWAHLASGRGIISSPGASGSLLFRPTTWLADVSMYLVFSVFGGTGLIIAKSLLIAITVAAMSSICFSWRTVLGLFLATLSLGGSLSLNPICLSYLFLTLTVLAINKAPNSDESDGWLSEMRSHKYLLVGYIFWANCDIWCLLGVGLIGIFAMSRSIVNALASEPGRSLWRLFALSLVAISLSLMPWYASAAAREFAHQLTGSEGGVSPFRSTVLSLLLRREFEGNIPVLAFWLLVVVGISSFIVAVRSPTEESRAQTWARLLPWLVLLGASAINSKFVPFFVVTCGASIALNFQLISSISHIRVTYFAARQQSSVELLRLSVQSLLSLLVAVTLLSACWAGWLQSLPAERRNWTIEPDPSLVKAAEEIKQWYSNGLLVPDQETVFFASDAEDTFAWFAPQVFAAGRSEERGPQGVAQVRTAILPADSGSGLPIKANSLLDKRVKCVVLCDTNRISFASALRSLTSAPDEWVLAHLRGRVAVFVRAGSGPAANPVSFASRAFDLVSADRVTKGDGSEFTIAPHWLDSFVVARPVRSLDRDEPATYLLYAEVTRERRRSKAANRLVATQLSSIVAAPVMNPVGWQVDPRVDILAQSVSAIPGSSEAWPPPFFDRLAAFLILTNSTADHYLAVRAARRGVAASPRDAVAYEALGEAYLNLLADPLESSWNQSYPTLRQLRLIQAAGAFYQALVIEPSLAIAHRNLATVYRQQGFLDLAADELRAYERYARLRGQPQSDVAEQLQKFERDIESARRLNETNAANLEVLDRARSAARNGLVGLALETLLQSDVAVFGSSGIEMELDLLLKVGRVREERELITPEHRKAIGALKYDWLNIQSSLVVGDYATASALLRNQINGSQVAQFSMTTKDFWSSVYITGNEIFIKRQNAPRMGLLLLASIVSGFAKSSGDVLIDYRAKTEGYLLLSFLALEEGDIKECAANLERIRDLWKNLEKDGEPVPLPQRIIAEQMMSLIRR